MQVEISLGGYGDYFASYLLADCQYAVGPVHGGKAAANAAGIEKESPLFDGVAGCVSVTVKDGIHLALELG